MSQRSIEVKVGILIIVALGLLGGFVVVMGGLSLQPTYTVYVDFDNPGGLKTGAPVRLAGMRIGRVSAIEFRGGQQEPEGRGQKPLIRVVASLESQYQDSLFENSKWFISTQGVLGELFLAVDPGSPDRPILKDGAVVHGISPPRLDLLLSEAYELLHRAYVAVTDNEEKIAETFDGLHRTLRGTGDFFDRNDEKIDRIVENVEAVTREAGDALRAAREQYVDNPRIDRILANVEGATGALDEHLGPVMTEGRQVLSDTSRLTATLTTDEQLERYTKLTRDVGDVAERARGAAVDAQALVTHVKRGQGTIGALMMDETLYDDLQELLRDLKHNPWKFFWRQ